MATEFGISKDDAVSELQQEVEEAINFMWSEFEDDWARAERYFAGGCDLPSDEGRSNAVKSEVRDVIRAVMPSIMRVLYQARKPVEFVPTNVYNAKFVEQQALYINQLFHASGGYKILYDAVHEAARLKVGPIKIWWEEEPTPEYFKYNGLTAAEVEQLKASPDLEVEDVEKSPKVGELFDVSGHRYWPFGKLHMESFPVYEFFVSRNARSLEDAKVHGHHREVTVAEALEMGLEYDDWSELEGTDPEEKQAAQQSRARRGYQTNHSEDESEDPTQRKILLTEVYCKFDLNGDGIEERYCFILGGTQHKYVDHYEIDDYCIELACLDPVPHTVIGRSIADIVIEMQDNETSILRAIIDNAHMANNPRMAADPNNTDFADVMNNATGAPIKVRGQPNIQIIDIPFTGGALIPFLEYLEQDTEQRVGVTKAATGLDPDALQSTDKDAVRNTIALSQGQVELMVRNIAEGALAPIFRKLLRLSIRYMDRLQIVRTKGEVLPVDIAMFDPELATEAKVGLGTASQEQRLATLNFVLQKQEQIFSTFGMDNPFTSLSLMYNTLEDIVELGGLNDPGRYFKIVTPEMEMQIAQQRAQQEAEAAQQAQSQEQQNQIAPTQALIMTEQIKARMKQMELMSDRDIKSRELELKAIESQEKLDIERDELAQERVIELRKIGAEALNSVIKKEQENNDAAGSTGNAPSSRREAG